MSMTYMKLTDVTFHLVREPRPAPSWMVSGPGALPHFSRLSARGLTAGITATAALARGDRSFAAMPTQADSGTDERTDPRVPLPTG